MIGIVYTDSSVDKLITLAAAHYGMATPGSITVGASVLDMSTDDGMLFFKNSMFTSRTYSLFRLVNVNVVPDDNFTFSETPTGASGEKIAFVSNDNTHIVAYRSSTYQIVTVASLLRSELIDIGALSFSDMQTVVTVAAGLTSPQLKYITPVGNDTVTFTEL